MLGARRDGLLNRITQPESGPAFLDYKPEYLLAAPGQASGGICYPKRAIAAMVARNVSTGSAARTISIGPAPVGRQR
jgi:hypothetical protein